MSFGKKVSSCGSLGYLFGLFLYMAVLYVIIGPVLRFIFKCFGKPKPPINPVTASPEPPPKKKPGPGTSPEPAIS